MGFGPEASPTSRGHHATDPSPIGEGVDQSITVAIALQCFVRQYAEIRVCGCGSCADGAQTGRRRSTMVADHCPFLAMGREFLQLGISLRSVTYKKIDIGCHAKRCGCIASPCVHYDSTTSDAAAVGIPQRYCLVVSY